jgi:hypothetical protein
VVWVEQLRAECAKNKVEVEFDEYAEARATLVRRGPRMDRQAELEIFGEQLRFTAGIKARAYHELSLNLAKPNWRARVDNDFAGQDLERLRGQLDELGRYRAEINIVDEQMTIELDWGRSLYGPIALCLKLWRELGPMAELHQVSRVKARKRRGRKKKGPYWIPAKDAVTKLTERITEATGHLQSVVARSGDATIEARVVGPYEDPARLVVGFATTRRVISRCDLRLVGDVPPALPDVHFKRRGFWKKLFGFLDAGIGVEALDAAWLVDDSEAGRVLADAAPSAMLSLAELRGEVAVTGKRLVLRVDELDVDRAVRSVTVGLLLWERLTEVGRGTG